MNYTEAVDYIETIPKFTVKHPPEHTRELLSRLGNPQEGIKIIHVAGTNGKGSVCAYLNAMLLAGGKKTGLFTSPHLVRINERFQINGEDVSDEQFLNAFLKVEKAAKEYEAEGEGHPSYFETLFLMGMLIFKEAGVEYLVMETGLADGWMRQMWSKSRWHASSRPSAATIPSILATPSRRLRERKPASSKPVSR